MKYSKDLVIKGLLDFRKILLDDKHNDIYYILRENYKSEAYYFKMDGLEFITYGTNVQSLVKSDNFINHFEEEYDNEFSLDKENYTPYTNPDYEYRLLDSNDSILMDNFKAKCSDNDKDQGQVTLDDPIVIGAFDKEELIAVASIWEWAYDLNDIGVLVDPNYRRKKLGISVVSKLINEVINDKICIYRADYENIGSVKIANKLGFTPVTKIHRLKVLK